MSSADCKPDPAQRPDAAARADVEAAIAAAALVADVAELGDDELARLAWALTDLRVRDTLYALAVGENAGQAESLWALLSRTLPEPWRVEALVLLAFSAYARGDGPLGRRIAGSGAALRPGAPDGRHARHRAAVGAAARKDPRSGDTGYRLADPARYVQLPGAVMRDIRVGRAGWDRLR